MGDGDEVGNLGDVPREYKLMGVVYFGTVQLFL
jgi:hypothetical protein